MTTFTLPTASEIIAGLSAYSSAYFTEYISIIYVVIGLAAAALGILWLQRKGTGFFGRLLGGRRGGRRRGRR